MTQEQREILDRAEDLIRDYGDAFRYCEIAKSIIDHIEENIDRVA